MATHRISEVEDQRDIALVTCTRVGNFSGGCRSGKLEVAKKRVEGRRGREYCVAVVVWLLATMLAVHVPRLRLAARADITAATLPCHTAQRTAEQTFPPSRSHIQRSRPTTPSTSQLT